VCILNVKVCVEKSVCVHREVYVLKYEKGVWKMYRVRGIFCGSL
jgi:hypothetical protein